MKLELFKEKIRPEGGAAAQGIMRALGRPRLDHVSVLVREAVQNSWDARTDESSSGNVAFTARLEKFTAAELERLEESVFAEKPTKHPIKGVLKNGLRRLILEDRGTVGLCGPVFVEKSPGPGDRFINFCRMFGRASEGPIGGGTYGYGKSVYFSSSQASTIVIHTRCLEQGKPQERLLALSLWRTNEQDLDTGRYWWGIPSRRHDGATGPVIGADAAKLAKSIGFTPFASDETGTSIMILAPKFHGVMERDPQLAARCIGESMVIWFWPRMLGAADRSGRLSFQVFCDGEAVAIPNPTKDSPFSTYATALNTLVARRKNKEIEQPHVAHEIRSEKPGARLGYLALALTPRHNRKEFAITQLDEQGDATIEDHAFADQVAAAEGERASCHHVALIRAPGQVIKYERFRAFHDASMEFGGVFLVDGKSDHADRDPEDVNLAFAKAEPPSHDDWAPDQLEDEWHKRYVRVAMRAIGNHVTAFTDAHRPQAEHTDQDPLGAISAELGELMSAPGSGAKPGDGDRGGGGGGGGGGASHGKIRMTIQDENGTLEEIDDKPVFVLGFRLEGEIPDDETLRIQATPRVLVAGGGTESEPPAGDAEPRVVGWRSTSRRKMVTKGHLDVESGDEGDWEVLVELPAEAMVGVSLSISNA